MYAVASCACAARRRRGKIGGAGLRRRRRVRHGQPQAAPQMGIQLADPVARNALPIRPDPSVAPLPAAAEIAVRARSADAFTSTVGKKAARASATAAAALRNAASAAGHVLVRDLDLPQQRVQHRIAEHRPPRRRGRARRPAAPRASPASHLYEGGTGAVGGTYSGPTVHAVRRQANRQPQNPGPSEPAQSDSRIHAGRDRSSRPGADRDFRLVPVIGADRIADRGEPVAAQPVGKPALDPSEQCRPLEDQRRVELHERGAGADLA